MNGLEQYRDLYPAHVQVQRCGPPHTSQFGEWLKQPLPLPLPADLILTSTGPLQCCAWAYECFKSAGQLWVWSALLGGAGGCVQPVVREWSVLAEALGTW